MKQIRLIGIILFALLMGCTYEDVTPNSVIIGNEMYSAYYGKLSVGNCYQAGRIILSPNAYCSTNMQSNAQQYFSIQTSRLIPGKYAITQSKSAINSDNPSILSANMNFYVNGEKRYLAKSGTIEILQISENDNIKVKIDVLLSATNNTNHDNIVYCSSSGCQCYRIEDTQKLNPLDCSQQIGDSEIQYLMEFTIPHCEAINDVIGVDFQQCPI